MEVSVVYTNWATSNLLQPKKNVYSLHPHPHPHSPVVSPSLSLLLLTEFSSFLQGLPMYIQWNSHNLSLAISRFLCLSYFLHSTYRPPPLPLRYLHPDCWCPHSFRSSLLRHLLQLWSFALSSAIFTHEVALYFSLSLFSSFFRVS